MTAPPTTPAEHYVTPRGKLSLWTGVLAGPVVWSVQLQAGYALSRFSHEHPSLTAAHHAVSLSAAALALAALLLAWRDWRRIGPGEPAHPDGGVLGRSRFLALLGMFTSAVFALLILAQWVPVFLIDPSIY